MKESERWDEIINSWKVMSGHWDDFIEQWEKIAKTHRRNYIFWLIMTVVFAGLLVIQIIVNIAEKTS